MPQLNFTSPRRIAGLAVASAALLFAAAACSSGTESTESTSTGGQNGGGMNNAAFTAYADCLKQNGVTITLPSAGARVRPSGAPDGEPGAMPSGMPRPSGSARPGGGGPGGGFPGGGAFSKPAGVDDATWEKAQSACASLRPSGRPGGGNGRGNGNGGNGTNAAYRNCLQDNGVTLGSGGLATTDPTVQKAMETCKALAPSAAPTS